MRDKIFDVKKDGYFAQSVNSNQGRGQLNYVAVYFRITLQHTNLVIFYRWYDTYRVGEQ